MTTERIPARETSRYAMQYAALGDPQRLVEIFTDSHSIALSSKNPDTARARFELAVETYHQLMAISSGDKRASIHSAMTLLADQFPTQVVLNEAIGLRERAAKLKTPRKKLEALQRAHIVLEQALASPLGGSSAIGDVIEEVRNEIAQIQDSIK